MHELGLVYCAAVWGSTFYLIKDALASIDPVAMVGYRFALSALLLLPIVLRKASPLRHFKESAWLALLVAILHGTQTVGLRYTSASNSGFITGLFVVFVPAFLFLFLKKPPTLSQWAGVALAVAGLWVITGGPRGFNRGDALSLVCAMAYAGHLLATDLYVRADADMVLLAFHQFWMTGVGCLALAAAFGLSLRVDSARAAGVTVFLALVPTISAFFVQMAAQKRVAPVKVALLFSFEPVFAAGFAWTLGGEAFRPSGAVGGALIVAGMAVSELSKLDLLKGRRKEVLPV
ncbi:MAG: DMT family transporter [Elusimicrobia bacterium]|nr:DMT family transporter [Elusimicrobiota bacterium]